MRLIFDSGRMCQIARDMTHASKKNATAKNGFRKTPINHVIRAF